MTIALHGKGISRGIALGTAHIIQRDSLEVLEYPIAEGDLPAELERLSAAVEEAKQSLRAMRERYPDVRLHVVESLSGHLTAMLNARQLDLAMLFDSQAGRRLSVMPLLEEKLFLIESRRAAGSPTRKRLSVAQLAGLPLILPTGSHGLRSTLESAFARAKFKPKVIAEIDSLAMLMDAVDSGLGCTLQPWAAVARFADAGQRFVLTELRDPLALRASALCSLSDDELSPAALAARVVLADCTREAVLSGRWVGARLTGETVA
jgi:LysR family tcuABC transcriptional regulator